MRSTYFCLILITLSLLTPKYSFGQKGGPDGKGEWSDVIPMPIVSVAASNLPNGKILTWSAFDRFRFGGNRGRTYTVIFDPATQQSEEFLISDTQHDMFCPGTANLSDGCLMVTGGSSSPKTSIYNPFSNEWTNSANLNIPRGYHAMTSLGDGSVITIGGSWSGGRGNKHAEIWDMETGQWTVKSGIPVDVIGGTGTDYHAWLWQAPNGKLFHAGPTREMHWVEYTKGEGSYTSAGFRDADDHGFSGTTVMYDTGKLLKVGGAVSYSGGQAANGITTIVDINEDEVKLKRVGSLNNPRALHNAIVLPTGEVFIAGGLATARYFSDTGSRLAPEIWNPETESWKTVSAMQVPRNYHSIGLLMSDGRIIFAGGGLCGTCTVNHPDAEIFSPPYLFNEDGTEAVRPTITQAPELAAQNSRIVVSADTEIEYFSIIRFNSATHGTDNEQRRIQLEAVDAGDNTYEIDLPGENVAVPGYYMLFAIDKNGVPSVSRSLRVIPEANISLGKKVSQSSVLSLGPENAIDGNRDGDIENNSIALTDLEQSPWWEIDLGLVYQLKDIHIFNRSDCCTERLTDFYILTSLVPFPSTDLTECLNDPNVSAVHVEETVGTDWLQSLYEDAQYLRIQLAGEDYLHLAEVEIHVQEGNGLKATYFNDDSLTQEVIRRNDKEINFEWGAQAPHPLVNPSPFSVRWEGQLLPKFSETYTFSTLVEGGVRLWIDEQLIIDNWDSQSANTFSAEIALAARKKVSLKMEYVNAAGNAMAKLQWQSASQVKEIIPLNQLSKPLRAKKPQEITFEEIPDKIPVDEPFEINVFASSGLPVGIQLIEGPVLIEGTTVTLTGEEGDVIIEANQHGDREYDAAENIRRTFSIRKEAQEITFEDISDKFITDEPFDLTATASSGLPVSFNIVEGPVSIEESTITILGSVGQVTIAATQEGDGQYYPADTVSKTFQISLPPSICELTGKITAEYWFGATGNKVKDIPLSRFPNAFVDRENFEAAVDTGDNYGLRMRGYICPPETGKYIFWIAADEEAELWLSSDRDPAHKSRIAFVKAKVAEREWEVSGSQRSVEIPLEAGEPYYIEALMKEQEGGDHLAVGWTLPDGTQQRPISGSHLSPYIPEEKVPQTISFSEIPAKSVTDDDFSLTATASSGLEVSFIVRSGPANVSGNILSLEGVLGTVVVEAVQEGNPLYEKAPSVIRSFAVTNGGICQVDGQILQEIWSGLAGNTIADIPLQEAPTSTVPLDMFEIETDANDAYGTRVSGLICPPLTGNYTFYIAADDFGELWLSTDDSVKHKVKIASSPGWTASREWDKYPEQTSAEMYLEAGKLYYVEALMIEGGGGDNLAVGWKLPGGELERPISGIHLGLPKAPEKLQQSISFKPVADKQVGDPDFLISAKASSGLKVTYSIESGPATIQGRKVSLLGSVGEVQVKARQEGNTVYEPTESLLTFQVSGPGTFDCSDKGRVSMEVWENVSGEEIGDIPVNKTPDAISTLELFEIPTNAADEYAVRIRGYICPPLSGEYSFWLSADEQAELWLSKDDLPVNKRKVAHVYEETPYRGWDYRASQRSAPIKLLAGQRYYVEALMKEGSGKDHLSVGWKLPTGEHERPIAGERLIPFSVSGASGGFTSLEEQVEASSELIRIYPNPSTGTIYLRWQGKAGEPENYSIRLCDMRGQCLIGREVSSSEGQVDVSALSNGVYHVLIQAGAYQQRSRVMVLD